MNVNPSKFTQKELAMIYEKMILLWELDLSRNAHFDGRSKKYSAVKKEYKMTINCIDTEAGMQEQFEQYNKQSSRNENHLSFYNKKNNLLLSLFYALRNAAAHGDIKKEKKGSRNYYIADHSFKNKIMIFGQIKAAAFLDIHSDLISLKRGVHK